MSNETFFIDPDDAIMNADDYEKEIEKDIKEIDINKNKFISVIKNGLGEQLNNFETYIKPESSRWDKIKNKVNKVFKSL